MRLLLLAALPALVVGCDGGPSEPSAVSLAVERCPVVDDVFCVTAATIAAALVNEDHEVLTEYSRPDVIVCAEVASDYFPRCTSNDRLEGHGLSGPDLIVDIVPSARYRDELASRIGGLDGVELLGIGTCGPDVPGRRSYHVAWTANGGDSLGSVELIAIDDEWSIVLWYDGTAADWQTTEPDPTRNAFCEAGRHPWRSEQS